MRILHIHSGNLYGGVETMLRTMARSRALAPDLDPVFALSYDGRIAAELRRAGCDVHILGQTRGRQPISIFHARSNLSGLCRRTKFEATAAHSAWSMALLAPAATRPLILFQHDLAGHHWTEIWARQTQPDLIVANSLFTASSLGRKYGNVPVVTIYPPVEMLIRNRSGEERFAIRKQFNTPAGGTVILTAGRFERWKGHRLLLDALAKLRTHPEWVLWIAGGVQRPHEIRLREELEAGARDSGMAERIVYLGHATNMPAVMRAADIYCQPNTEPEPFGLTFIEALHAGIPIVTTRLGGAREILEPAWGLLAEPTAVSVAAALEKLIHDRPLRMRLAEAGPPRARQLCDPGTQIQTLSRAIAFARNARVAA